MRPLPEPEYTIEEVSELLSSGILSAVDVVKGCLARIDEWEPKVHAWVVVDREGALKRARELDREREDRGKTVGPLHGIPVGIKDIIDVEGLPTSAGAKLWGGGRPAEKDADLVARLREAGAIILGKTVTTPYAWIDPPPTRNPWNLDRTPGGSSSGSAVAVATGMCLGAFGTQTGGSIIRPAAFCGVAGFKPTRWTSISGRGIVPFAPSLDTPGPFASSVEGLRQLYYPASIDVDSRSGDDGSSPFSNGSPGPRLGHLRGFFDAQVDREMARAVDETVARLEGASATVVKIDLSAGFADVRRAHRVVMAAEAARQHGRRLEGVPEDYPPRITELILEGRSILATDYLDALYLRGPMADLIPKLDEVEVFLTPAAIGPATDRSATGDPILNSPWTYLDFPAVSLPIGLSDDGLPLAVQLVGYSDIDELFDVAAWCERVLRDRTPRD